jgi:hypothetical protein
MANLPISQLPEISSGLTSNAEFAVSQGGTTYKVKRASLAYGKPYLSAYHIPSQSGFTANTAYSMSATTISESYNISVVDSTKFTVASGGTYNLQFSAQLLKIQGGQTEDFDIWLSKNGSDVPYSNTNISVNSNNEALVAAWNFVISLNAGDYLELKFSSTSQYFILYAEGPLSNPTRPSIPSLIVTMVQV